MRTVLILAMFLAGHARAEAPKVVTDIAAVHSLAALVMGSTGMPDLLLAPGGDPHSFQLRPSQARALAEADLVFWIGPELTPWLGRALEGAGIAGAAVALLDAQETIRRSLDAEAPDDHAALHGGTDAAVDPHAWLDPDNARAWLGVIAARLAAADPANAATYAANAEAAGTALAALDAEIAAMLAPAAGAPIYVFHDAYGYFADAYGLTIAGHLADSDAASPGAASLAAIRAAIARSGAACVFAEANRNPGYVANVTEGAGVRTGTLDPDGVFVAPGADYYAQLMRALARDIVACVAGR